MESISPGLNPHETTIFHFILRDTFSGIPMVKELLGNISPTGYNHEIPSHTHLSFGPASLRKKEVVLEPVLTQVRNNYDLSLSRQLSGSGPLSLSCGVSFVP